MNRKNPLRIRPSGLTTLAGLATVLAFCGVAAAPPPGPKPRGARPPAAGPKHPVGTPKIHHPKPKLAKPHPRLHAHRVRARAHTRVRRYYWYPKYRRPLPKPVWPIIGYTYYPSTTVEYVAVPQSAEPKSETNIVITGSDPASSETATAAGSASSNRYVQIQELAELIHEWRTLNESPAFHERVLAAEASEQHRSALDKIRQKNQEFDAAAKQAMEQLAEGRSAYTWIESARQALACLIELAEALPEASQEQASSLASES